MNFCQQLKFYLIFFGGLFTLYSCQEDDTSWKKEIENLKQELSNQKALIEALDKNAYVSSIENYSDYYIIHFSNGQSVTLSNGKTPQITIGDDGYWYIDGARTSTQAQGNTTVVLIGDNGNWIINGTDTGVSAGEATGSSSSSVQSVVVNGYIFTFNFADKTSISCLMDSSMVDKDHLVTLTDNPLQTIKYTPGFAAIFKSWGFIGDSFCSGEMAYIGSDSLKHYDDMYEYSWGQCLCRMCGSEGENFSIGGLTTTTWLNVEHPRCWYGAKDSPKQAYIIALGYNDINCNLPVGDLKTDVNLADSSNTKETYAGNMAAIIKKVKSVSPDAFIFCVTMPRNQDGVNFEYDVYNDVVRQLPDYFNNVYVLDLYKYAPAYDAEFRSKYFLNDHMSAVGYQYTAYMFATYIDWIVRSNSSDFVSAALVNKE